MTQKELAYVEDAINHEHAITIICDDIINNLKSNKLRSFMKEELKKHQILHSNLIMGLENE